MQQRLKEVVAEFEKKFGEISKKTRYEFRKAILMDYEDDLRELTLRDAVEIFDASGLQLKKEK